MGATTLILTDPDEKFYEYTFEFEDGYGAGQGVYEHRAFFNISYRKRLGDL
jgi:hypothetical protein